MGKIIRKAIRLGDKPTQAQIDEINKAYKQPVVFNEDETDYSYEEILELVKLAKAKKNERKKESVTLRVSTSTLKKARATGKGYTGFLSRLLDNAINNKDLVSRSL